MSIFSTIGHIIGGAVTGLATGGPLGAAEGAVAGALPSKAAKMSPQQRAAVLASQGSYGRAAGVLQRAGVQVPVNYLNPGKQPAGISINPPFFGAPGAGVTVTSPGGQQYNFGVAESGPSMNGNRGCGGCPSGYHPNKSSYFLKDGTFVPEGSRCVKNRRRNPGNMRALDRALGRLNSAKRLQAKLHQYSTGKYTKAGTKTKC